MQLWGALRVTKEIGKNMPRILQPNKETLEKNNNAIGDKQLIVERVISSWPSSASPEASVEGAKELWVPEKGNQLAVTVLAQAEKR